MACTALKWMKLMYHLAALGTSHYCLAVVAFTREQRPVRKSRNGMHGVVVLFWTTLVRNLLGREASTDPHRHRLLVQVGGRGSRSCSF